MIGRDHLDPSEKGGTGMTLKGQLKEFDASRNRPPDVVMAIRNIVGG